MGLEIFWHGPREPLVEAYRDSKPIAAIGSKCGGSADTQEGVMLYQPNTSAQDEAVKIVRGRTPPLRHGCELFVAD